MSKTKEPVRIRRPRSPRVSIVITEELIKTSTQKDSSHCMIAEAVRAAYPTAKNIAVDLQTIRLSDPAKGLRYTYLTPRIAQVALVNFDQGRLPEPFEVTLRNAQVTSTKHQPRKLSESEQQQRKRAAKKGREVLQRATLRPSEGGRAGGVLERTGGKTPPLGSFARRRSFGLRALER